MLIQNIENYRKSIPNLLAGNICKVQPMMVPTNLVFQFQPGRIILRKKILCNIEIMKRKPRPAKYENIPYGYCRELNVFKQKNSIEFVKDV